MSTFEEFFAGLADKLGDFTSLDVTTLQGSVVFAANEQETEFDKILALAGKTDASIKLLASTQIKLDGDIVVFLDKDIDTESKQAHADMVQMGMNNRKAVLEMVLAAVGKTVK